jgi:hypothetical protein
MEIRIMTRPRYHTPLSETLDELGLLVAAGYFVILLFLGVANLVIAGPASPDALAAMEFCLSGMLLGSIAHAIGKIWERHRMVCATRLYTPHREEDDWDRLAKALNEINLKPKE